MWQARQSVHYTSNPTILTITQAIFLKKDTKSIHKLQTMVQQTTQPIGGEGWNMAMAASRKTYYEFIPKSSTKCGNCILLTRYY